jgi:GMP synthase-like glutamine amidotransferase
VEEQQESQVIVLQADGAIDGQHGYGHPIRLRLEEYGILAEIVDIPNNADELDTLPPKPIIISGGMTEVTSKTEWIIETKRFLRKQIETNRRNPSAEKRGILGICFGAQLIAEALHPGSVQYLYDPEIGTSHIVLDKPNHPLFQGFENEFQAFSFHYNQIRPESISVISDHHYKGHHFIQAFEIPDSATYGVQFHPEFRRQEFKKLLVTYNTLLEDLGVDLKPILANLPSLQGTERILLNFLSMHPY